MASSADNPSDGNNGVDGSSRQIKIDHYIVEGKLAQGGMGIVYLAHEPALDRKVALKFLSAELSQSPKVCERFAREAKAAAVLQHPNIVSIFFRGTFKGRPYFAMEYVDNGSLEDIGERGLMRPDVALDFMIQAAKGLQAAWKSGKVHRDVKPANLMVTSSNVLKIADFGLAKALDNESGLTTANMIVGTPDFISPEQAQGDPVDCRSDIYSLGATFYYLTSGVRPFTGDSAMGVLVKHISAPLTPLSQRNRNLPPDFCRTIEKMMEKKADDRFQDYDELIAHLEPMKVALRTEMEQIACEQTIASSDGSFPVPGDVSSSETIAAVSPSAALRAAQEQKAETSSQAASTALTVEAPAVSSDSMSTDRTLISGESPVPSASQKAALRKTKSPKSSAVKMKPVSSSDSSPGSVAVGTEKKAKLMKVLQVAGLCLLLLSAGYGAVSFFRQRRARRIRQDRQIHGTEVTSNTAQSGSGSLDTDPQGHSGSGVVPADETPPAAISTPIDVSAPQKDPLAQLPPDNGGDLPVLVNQPVDDGSPPVTVVADTMKVTDMSWAQARAVLNEVAFVYGDFHRANQLTPQLIEAGQREIPDTYSIPVLSPSGVMSFAVEPSLKWTNEVRKVSSFGFDRQASEEVEKAILELRLTFFCAPPVIKALHMALKNELPEVMAAKPPATPPHPMVKEYIDKGIDPNADSADRKLWGQYYEMIFASIRFAGVDARKLIVPTWRFLGDSMTDNAFKHLKELSKGARHVTRALMKIVRVGEDPLADCHALGKVLPELPMNIYDSQGIQVYRSLWVAFKILAKHSLSTGVAFDCFKTVSAYDYIDVVSPDKERFREFLRDLPEVQGLHSMPYERVSVALSLMNPLLGGGSIIEHLEPCPVALDNLLIENKRFLQDLSHTDGFIQKQALISLLIACAKTPDGQKRIGQRLGGNVAIDLLVQDWKAFGKQPELSNFYQMIQGVSWKLQILLEDHKGYWFEQRDILEGLYSFLVHCPDTPHSRTLLKMFLHENKELLGTFETWRKPELKELGGKAKAADADLDDRFYDAILMMLFHGRIETEHLLGYFQDTDSLAPDRLGEDEKMRWEVLQTAWGDLWSRVARGIVEHDKGGSSEEILSALFPGKSIKMVDYLVDAFRKGDLVSAEVAFVEVCRIVAKNSTRQGIALCRWPRFNMPPQGSGKTPPPVDSRLITSLFGDLSSAPEPDLLAMNTSQMVAFLRMVRGRSISDAEIDGIFSLVHSSSSDVTGGDSASMTGDNQRFLRPRFDGDRIRRRIDDRRNLRRPPRMR